MEEAKLEKRIIQKSAEVSDDNYLEIKDFIFYVKDYQRSYKWEDKQVKALLNDLQKFELQSQNSS